MRFFTAAAPVLRWACWLLLLVLGCAAAPADESASRAPTAVGANARQSRGARDWSKYPAVVDVKAPADIVALGDVHGDYGRLVALLAAGKIIPKAPPAPARVEWAGGKTVLVCTGDLIDKGTESLQVLLFVRALQTAAARDGGKVILTMGNHEAEFLADPANKKAVKFAAELKANKLLPTDVAAGRDALGIGAFLRSLPFAARVNDWFFAHAGDTRRRSLKQLTSELREGVDARGYDPKRTPALDALLEARSTPPPAWWEKGGKGGGTSKAKLAVYAQALGVKHFVFGHQSGDVIFSDGTRRRRGHLFQHYDGLLFLIDVGMSRGLKQGEGLGYSPGALLRIRPGEAIAIHHDGREQILWGRGR